MKPYLTITGLLFGAMTVVHLVRVIDEWPHGEVDIGFVGIIFGLVVIPAILTVWAWFLLRKIKKQRKDAQRWKYVRD